MSASSKQQTVERLTLNQRVQHVLLVVVFLTLLVSGLPLRHAHTGLAQMLLAFPASAAARGVTHRVAAAALIALVLYHACCVLFTRRGHAEFLELMPGCRDLRDALDMLRYYLGLSREPPPFGRYSFTAKFEYCVIAAGSAVMIGTGILVWSLEKALLVFPRWVVDIARAIHSYEALLVFVAIIVWHLYHVHLNPTVFPMDGVWLHGRMSLKELKANHRLEYDERVRRGEIAEVE